MEKEKMECKHCGKELRHNSYYDYVFHIENGMQTYGCLRPEPRKRKSERRMEEHCRACGKLVKEHKEQESLNCSRRIITFDNKSQNSEGK